MADSPEEIQAQIEATRAELASTVEQIADRVSPAKVATRGATAARAKVDEVFGRPGEEGGLGAVRWERVGGVAGGLVLVVLLRRQRAKRRAAAPRNVAIAQARAAREQLQKNAKKAAKAPAVKKGKAQGKRAVKRAAKARAELHVALNDLQSAIAAHAPHS